MSERTYSISEIREVITRLPEQFEEDLEEVTVTRHGKPVMTILPTKTYRELVDTVESLLETLDILQDQELMRSFREGVQAMQEGDVTPLEDVFKRLGWE